MGIKSKISKYFNRQTAHGAVSTLGMTGLSVIKFIDGSLGQTAACVILAAISGYFWHKDVNQQGPKPPSA